MPRWATLRGQLKGPTSTMAQFKIGRHVTYTDMVGQRRRNIFNSNLNYTGSPIVKWSQKSFFVGEATFSTHAVAYQCNSAYRNSHCAQRPWRIRPRHWSRELSAFPVARKPEVVDQQATSWISSFSPDHWRKLYSHQITNSLIYISNLQLQLVKHYYSRPYWLAD